MRNPLALAVAFVLIPLFIGVDIHLIRRGFPESYVASHPRWVRIAQTSVFNLGIVVLIVGVIREVSRQ